MLANFTNTLVSTCNLQPARGRGPDDVLSEVAPAGWHGWRQDDAARQASTETAQWLHAAIGDRARWLDSGDP
ncbi:MAG: hypothetical protein CMJ18_17035 [Phycisphaeraceae bacterium]|nr:hypothetical protein [Phycisphaeraceae bacterium]